MKDRYKIFHRNMKKAKQFMESEEGTAVYGPNEFSDMSGNKGELKLLCLFFFRYFSINEIFLVLPQRRNLLVITATQCGTHRTTQV